MNIKKIVIGIDNSNFAEYAASYGFNLARTLNAEVGLVHIVEPGVVPPTSTDGTGIGLSGFGLSSDGLANAEMAEVIQIREHTHHELLQHTIDRFGEGLQVTQLTEFGSTSDGIISCSKDFGADLIVIGTHSRTGLDRFLMGNVAEKVIRESMIPVLVVPMNAIDEANTTA